MSIFPSFASLSILWNSSLLSACIPEIPSSM
jgi:hypothetical protein